MSIKITTSDGSISVEGVSKETPEAKTPTETQSSEPVKKAGEIKEESETSEEISTDENLESESKEGIEDDESEESDESESDEGKKPSRGIRKRIKKLSERASRAEQRAVEAEEQAKYFREQALKGNPQKPESKEKPQEFGKPKPESFDTHEEWVEAVTDWKFDQRKAKENLERQAFEKSQKIKSHIDKFKESTDDYDEVVSSVDNFLLPNAALEAIQESDDPARLTYELAKNPKELERISKLSPLAVIREIGKFEAKLQSRSESSEIVNQNKKPKAPAPINPVGNKASSGVKKSIYDAEKISQSEYEKMRMDQIRAQRRA